MKPISMQATELEELEDIAKKVIELSSDSKIILLEGELGSGKTALTKFICKLLHVKDEVSSPTFSLVNEYQTENGETIYHFDLYRLNSIEEAIDIGCEEYFNSGNLCLIEWPKLAMGLIPEERVQIAIEMQEKNRLFNINKLPHVR